MTNAAIKATFSTHKTNRVVQGDLDHLPVRFACVGDKRVHVERTGGADGVSCETFPADEFQFRLAEELDRMSEGYSWGKPCWQH
jgi:hypothetical protein